MFVCLATITFVAACGGGKNSDTGGRQKDPHVVPNEKDWEENPKFVSPPTLGHPIYACSTNVTISNFIKGATLNVFIDGAPAPNPSVVGQVPEIGVNFDVGAAFTVGQVVTVTQTFNGATSLPSNAVPVTSHTVDYPTGLPKPRLFKHPLRQCGHAVLVEDTVPGSKVDVFAENSAGPGTFGPKATVGGFSSSTNWGWNWTGVTPQFELGARVSAQAKLCTDTSPVSDFEITIPPPAPMPAGTVEPPVIEGQDLVTIWGAGGPGDPPQHGPILKVYRNNGAGPVVGSTPAPGGAPHLLGISPAATSGVPHIATQTLCAESNPGDSTPTPTLPCSEMPAPKIKPPLPGDTKIYVTEHIPGAEILVFAGAEEVGHSGGNVINLSRALLNGETVKVMQRLGKCMSPFRYQIVVDCALGDNPRACSGEWSAFRHNGLRNARQTKASPLGDPYAVKTLQIVWNFNSPDGGSFTASPVVFNNRLYIGTSNGHLFAFDATTGGAPVGTPLWQFPPAGQPALTTQWATAGPCANPSSVGIASSVAMAKIDGVDVVILAAPDQGRPSDPGGKFGSGLGSGRLFALNAQTGAVIWATRSEVARMTGLTDSSTSEFHEQIGYSSPLVLDSRIYVGIANHCDNPIQNGRIVAVELNTGNIVPSGTFKFESTSDRGGGVWTFISGGLGGGIFTTTGNVRRGSAPEPAVNNGLSMIRLNPGTGALEGKIQPVPFQLDNDPDWSAGTTLMAASCGNLSVSTQKDGWSYAGNLGPPLSFRWQFPNVAFPFPTNDPNDHGDIRYHRAGAAWNDLYIGMVGGEDIVDRDTPGEIFAGYRRLHALNTCAGTGGRVAWIAELQAFTNEVTDTHGWGLGPPTVTDGIVYVGTNAGWLVAVADPSVWPANGSRCTWSHLDGVACLDAGFQMVPKAAVLKSMNLGAGVITRNEPVIANGSLYVATSGGKLFRIAPK